MPSIQTASVTSNSATCYVAGLSNAYSRADRTCTWTLDGIPKGTSTLGAYVTQGGNYTFWGLSPDTTYVVGVSITAPDVSGTGTLTYYEGSRSVTTLKSRPNDFYWPASTGSTGDPINVTASDWNAFCDRINEFRAYEGMAKITLPKVTQGQPMRASQYNEVLEAILAFADHGPQVSASSYVTSQSAITKKQFNNLALALNAIP